MLKRTLNQVHKHILTKSEYFKKALCGEFRESATQSIDLPEENPSIFHFLVAYLYEGRYDPIKPASSALCKSRPPPWQYRCPKANQRRLRHLAAADVDKGKGKDPAASTDASSGSSDSEGSPDSDISAASRRRRARRRRREDRHWEHMRQKHPGMHRPNCGCPTCMTASGPPCWACAAPRAPPPQPITFHPPVVMLANGGVHPRHHHHHHQQQHRGPPMPHPHPRNHRDRVAARPPRRRYYPGSPPRARTPPTPTAGGGSGSGWDPADPNGGGRIRGEDLRTWLLAYELNIDVYVLANKFLLEGFKREIARAAIDMLETAGSDAAVPEVLCLCGKLYSGLAESDPLLRMVFARVGFLQPLLWRRAPDDTNGFLVANPEIAALVLRETVARREEDISGRFLPSMERLWLPLPPPPPPDPRFPYQQQHWLRAGPRW